jgi:predicted transcriptional regulator
MEQANATPGMRRTEIRTVLGRHRGSKSRIATELGVSQAAISVWLSGRSKSKRIADAAGKLAVELLTAETRVSA